MTNSQIAGRLNVEPSTVEAHVHSILTQLMLKGRGEAARVYLRSQGDL